MAGFIWLLMAFLGVGCFLPFLDCCGRFWSDLSINFSSSAMIYMLHDDYSQFYMNLDFSG